jgi:hypothetical protein
MPTSLDWPGVHPSRYPGVIAAIPEPARAPAATTVVAVRIWDLEPRLLCDQHLLGEHRELHAVWSVLTTGKTGYARHPETLRWRGRLAALYVRHEQQVAEMHRRGFRHASPLDDRLATGEARQTEFVDSLEAQRARLAARGCACRVQPARAAPTASRSPRST